MFVGWHYKMSRKRFLRERKLVSAKRVKLSGLGKGMQTIFFHTPVNGRRKKPNKRVRGKGRGIIRDNAIISKEITKFKE